MKQPTLKRIALAIAGQGLLIGGSGLYLIVEGVRRLITPEPLRLAAVTLGTMLVSMVLVLILLRLPPQELPTHRISAFLSVPMRRGPCCQGSGLPKLRSSNLS